MTKLDIAKQIINENYESAEHGLFNSRNLVGDHMENLYHKDGLIIDICYYWSYFEVFGLSKDEFAELFKFYHSLSVRKEE